MLIYRPLQSCVLQITLFVQLILKGKKKEESKKERRRSGEDKN